MVEYSSTVIESVFVLPSTDCTLYILIKSCYHTMIPVLFVFEKLQFSFNIDPGLCFLKVWLSLKKVGKHKGTNWTRSATLHLFPYCKDLVFVQLTAEVELIVWKQKYPILVSDLTNLLKYLWKRSAFWIALCASWLQIWSNCDPLM